MRPLLTELSVLGVTWPLAGYGALVATGVLGGLLLWLVQGVRVGLHPGVVAAVAGPTLGGGFIGAYLFSSLAVAGQTGDLMGALSAPSVAFYGGALGGLAGSALFCRAFGFPFAALADAAVEPLALGHALGRVGCLLGGCCFGQPSEVPWAVAGVPHSPMGAVLRHPVQLYEALGVLALAVALARLLPLAKPPASPAGPLETTAPVGTRLAAYALGYACLRFGLEYWRADPVRGLWALGLSTSQWCSLAIGAVLLAALGVRRWRLGRALG